jgi:hypothetical protein
MKYSKIKQDNGIAGLTIILSLIVMLFVIGLLIMVFSIMSGKLADSDTLYQNDIVGAGVNESVTITTSAGATLYAGTLRDGSCGTITAVFNATNDYPITAGNYTQTGCNLVNTTNTATIPRTGWKVSYPYTYSADSYGSVGVINDTTNAIATTTDWFDIFIVIGAMVVLILLTVLIIGAIRGSGMVGGNENGGCNKVGTA